MTTKGEVGLMKDEREGVYLAAELRQLIELGDHASNFQVQKTYWKTKKETLAYKNMDFTIILQVA